MSKFVVKNLKKSVENLNKRIDELEAGDLDILKELLLALEFLLEEVGDPTSAIDKYNEIISFLDLIENTSKLKNLLDDIRNSIPEAPVQSDWAQDDNTLVDYIKNKPNLATVATTGSYNDLTDKPAIPTKVSDLTNNSDFLKNPHISNGHEYVEIAGMKWATMNIGATSTTDKGLFFAWGETDGYRYDDNSKSFSISDYKYAESDGSDYVYTKYNDTDQKTLLDLEDDPARVNWGGNWRMPTAEEFNALILACTISIVYDTGVISREMQLTGDLIGFILTDKTDSTKTIFFPETLFKRNGNGPISLSDGVNMCSYWINKVDTSAHKAAATSGDYTYTNETWTGSFGFYHISDFVYAGRAVRPILDEQSTPSTVAEVAITGDYNDLINKPTIPDVNNFLQKPNSLDYVEIGGIKWATKNIGAETSTDTGLFFLWGDTQGYTVEQVGDGPNDMRFDWEHYKYGTAVYNMTKYVDGDTLELEDDAAYNILGEQWRVPSEQDFETLLSSTTHSLVYNYNNSGVTGVLFVDKLNASNKLFLPLGGTDNDGVDDHYAIEFVGELGHYWTNKMSENTIYQKDAYAQIFNISFQNECSISTAARSIAACIRPIFVGNSNRFLREDNTWANVNYNDLSNKPTIPAEQIQSDWNQSDTAAKDYIKNKPTIPTKLSDLQNDAGFAPNPEIIRVVEISENLSNLTTSVSGIENDGKRETVIYVNNTENTYYITVSNSYKTLRNTQLSLVACPGGYCEVSYINKGGIIFAKGLVMGVKQSDPNSKYILATYDVTNTNAETPLIPSRALSTYADMEIDGELLPSLVASYNFDTVGEHTVKFILPDLEQFDEQNGIKFGWMGTGNKLKSIVLPEGITTIPNEAFYACQSLESVTLPSTIRTIGNEAFGSYFSGTYIGCDKLSSINIPNGVTSIGYRCFVGCTSLTSITIPNSVTSLGYNSFSLCTNLTTVSLGTGLTTLQNEMFRGCTSLTDVTIPNTITSILESVFCGCSSLQTIVIPDSVTNFGGAYPYLNTYEGVFADCTSLTNVTLGNNIRSLKGHDFYNCTSLQTLNIPDKLQYFDSTAFKGCSSLTAFNVSNNNANLSSIDGVIYNKDATMLVKYPTAKQGIFTIPSTVTSLGDTNQQSPFAYCDGITTIEIGLNVSSIYPNNFLMCSSLTAINVDANNQTYSSISGVLYNKNASKLIRCPQGKQSVTIPNTVTELGDYSFMRCANITTIDIPNSVTTIGVSTFDNCTNLSTITIPSSVTSVEDCYNFVNCNSLPVINDIRYADTYAIRCTSEGKSTYTIKSGTRFIGCGAFEDQENLQNITIPSTVIAMGDYVFDNCSKLLTITFEETTAPSVLPDTFRGVKSSGGTIRVPANSTGYDVIMQKNGLSNWTKVEY